MTDTVDPRLRALAQTLLDELPDRGALVADEVRRRLPSYREGGVSPDDLRASCVENLRFVLEAIVHGTAADPAPAAATGIRRAQAGVPLPMVLAAYRIGFQAMWRQMAEVVEETGLRDLPAEVVLSTTIDAMAAHEAFTEAMSAAYDTTVRERLLRQEAERSAVVEAVLTGSHLDRRSLWEAADVLGLPLSGAYVVVALGLPEPGRFALPAIEGGLAERGHRSAWRLLPTAQVGIVALEADEVDALVELLGTDGVAMGVSPVFDDLAGAGQALDHARLALVTAARSGGVVRFGEAPVGVAAAAAGTVMDRLADEVMGGLDALGEAERATVIETLRAWVEADGSATKAAGRLYCHPNTVRLRLRRFEDCTGRRLSRPTDVAALCLALQVERFG